MFTYHLYYKKAENPLGQGVQAFHVHGHSSNELLIEEVCNEPVFCIWQQLRRNFMQKGPASKNVEHAARADKRAFSSVKAWKISVVRAPIGRAFFAAVAGFSPHHH
jgi:hypothetical protein